MLNTVSKPIKARFNPMLAMGPVFLRVMFKKLLLATLIDIIGMWGAGYDVAAMKDDIWHAANKQAGALSARARMENSDWGENTI
jgi:hypothetical protein